MFKAILLNKGTLSDREAEVLRCLCEGLPDKCIARVLNISIKTVDAHLKHVYLKLDVKQNAINSRVAAILTALNDGLVQVTKGI